MKSVVFSINRGRIQDFQIEGMEGAQTIMCIYLAHIVSAKREVYYGWRALGF